VRIVDVAEYGTLERVALNRSQRDAVLSCGGDIGLAPEPGAEDLWRLRAGSHVGSVVTPGLGVRIWPKVTIARLFVMLSAAAGVIRWDSRLVGLQESATVEDVVATVLVDAIRRGMATGMLRGYVTIEEESFVVRGKLEIAETVRRRPATLAPLVQTPEFLDEDTAENRVLATALKQLVSRVQSPLTRGRVVACQRDFAHVSLIRRGSALPRLSRNRLNARWWGALELALLVLRSCGLDLPSGAHAAPAFLVDMNVVYERFVHRAMAEEVGKRGLMLQHSAGGVYLDEGRCHSLRPDLSIWEGTRCLFVGDCKYKPSEDAMAQRTDVYQCLAYAAATGLRQIMLIYGGTAAQARDVEIVDGRTIVAVRTLDLGASTVMLKEQFRRLAQEVVPDREIVVG